MKEFHLQLGAVMMDASFVAHLNNCERCVQYNSDNPATLALCCPEGSILLKRELAGKRSKPPAQRDPNRCSKDELKRLMQYK